jgi:hypothetical protein
MASKKKNPKNPAAKAAKTPKKAAQASPVPEPETQAAPAAAGDPTQAKPLSAVAAALRVLTETGQPMTCPELIAAMAEKGYWSSPAGKTPASTLYSALTREIKTKKDQARFRKTQRGQFGLA